MRLVVIAWLLAGCHPYIAAGVSPAWKTKGRLASAVGETVTSRSISAAATETPTSTPPGNAYELELGSSYYDFFVGVNAQVHDVTTASLPAFMGGSTADGTPRYINATATLEVAWAWLHWNWLSSYIHAGPARSLLYDRSGGPISWGFGYRYGGALAVSYERLSIYADLYKTGVVFGDGPADGFSSTTGVTVGIAFHR